MALNIVATTRVLGFETMDTWFHKNYREGPARRMESYGDRFRLPSDASQWIDFKERAFKVLLIVAPLFVFLAIVTWDLLPINAPAPPKQVSAETRQLMAMSEEEMRAKVWPTSAEDIEAAQPEFGGKAIGDLITVQFSRCGTGSRFTCVVDGDTLWYKGDRIRIADIDAPEVTNPECAREIAMGERATARLLTLLNAGPISLQTTDTEYDRYGRRLLKVTRSGKSLGTTLVNEGLAERWGGPRIDWCSR
jgi:endonuclease YncB( thermonuclease family)